jgi:hypothetical protein
MTWTMIHCDFPTFKTEEEVKAYMEKKVKQAKEKAEREQVIVTKQQDDAWIATLAGDWRSGTGTTEERAIGDLWLMYSHEIIERIQK